MKTREIRFANYREQPTSEGRYWTAEQRRVYDELRAVYCWNVHKLRHKLAERGIFKTDQQIRTREQKRAVKKTRESQVATREDIIRYGPLFGLELQDMLGIIEPKTHH